jgi:hypothetical protein
MKKFWKVVGVIFEWIMNVIFAAILFGGGAWCIWEMFIK